MCLQCTCSHGGSPSTMQVHHMSVTHDVPAMHLHCSCQASPPSSLELPNKQASQASNLQPTPNHPQCRQEKESRNSLPQARPLTQLTNQPHNNTVQGRIKCITAKATAPWRAVLALMNLQRTMHHRQIRGYRHGQHVAALGESSTAVPLASQRLPDAAPSQMKNPAAFDNQTADVLGADTTVTLGPGEEVIGGPPKPCCCCC